MRCQFSRIVGDIRVACTATADKVIHGEGYKHVVCLKHFYMWKHHPRDGYGLGVVPKKEDE